MYTVRPFRQQLIDARTGAGKRAGVRKAEYDINGRLTAGEDIRTGARVGRPMNNLSVTGTGSGMDWLDRQRERKAAHYAGPVGEPGPQPIASNSKPMGGVNWRNSLTGGTQSEMTPVAAPELPVTPKEMAPGRTDRRGPQLSDLAAPQEHLGPQAYATGLGQRAIDIDPKYGGGIGKATGVTEDGTRRTALTAAPATVDAKVAAAKPWEEGTSSWRSSLGGGLEQRVDLSPAAPKAAVTAGPPTPPTPAGSPVASNPVGAMAGAMAGAEPDEEEARKKMRSRMAAY